MYDGRNRMSSLDDHGKPVRTVIGDGRATPDGAAGLKTAPPGTVHRSLRLLRALSEASSDVSVSELSQILDLPRSTIHRLLNLFREEGLVTVSTETRRYDVGSELYRIASLIMSRRNIVDLARPTMEGVVEEGHETCLLGLYLPAQKAMMFAAKVDSPNPLGYRVDLLKPVSVVWAASGRAILAWLRPAEVDTLLSSSIAPSAEGEELDPEAVRHELTEIRERGYAQTLGQKVAGSYGIAAPIFESGGAAIGSLCISMPAMRVTPDTERQFSPLLVSAAAQVSHLLGHRGS